MKKILLITLLMVLCVFTSCYNFESENIDQYSSFREKMQKKSDFIYQLLPVVENIDSVKDMYLFYNDKDLIDSSYVVYLNCEYEESQYAREIDRLSSIIENSELITKNSNSFKYNSFVYTEIIDHNGSNGSGIIRYEYVLYNEEKHKIVYVSIFEDELNGNSKKIPEEYLPRELIEARK